MTDPTWLPPFHCSTYIVNVPKNTRYLPVLSVIISSCYSEIWSPFQVGLTPATPLLAHHSTPNQRVEVLNTGWVQVLNTGQHIADS